MSASKLTIFSFLLLITTVLQAQKRPVTAPVETDGKADRRFWISMLDKTARPVLRSLAHDSLRINMPTAVSIRSDNPESRRKVQYVEVLGRVLSGIAPWLQGEGGDPDEVALRRQYRQWSLEALKNALDSSAKDFMPFNINGQQLVDASFLAMAFHRAPWLWENLDANSKTLMVNSFRATRVFKPGFSNWLCFSAMTECFFAEYGYDWDPMRVDYAMQQMEQWYRGDGMYSDGPAFAFDYYNSYVIHPYLAAISDIMVKKNGSYRELAQKIAKRNKRYAVIQERMINADGSFPLIGRSLIYRGAAFQHLADVASRKQLPGALSPASVRCALTAVIRKTMESKSTFDKNGWLSIGLYGAQADIADVYNNSGSPYLCTAIFLPLGLSPDDPFWSNPPEEWTSKKAWSGKEVPNDHGQPLF